MKSRFAFSFANIMGSGKSVDKKTGLFVMSDNAIRYVILNCIIIFGVAVLIFFAITDMRSNLLFEALVSSIMAGIGILCFFAARSKIPQIGLSWFLLTFFALFCCLVIWNGGTRDSGLVESGYLFVYLYPPLAIILLGMTGGIVISFLLIFVIAVEFLVFNASEVARDPGVFFMMIFSYLLVTMIVTVFERSRQNKDKLNRKLNDELQNINENLQEIVEERTNSLLKLRDCFGRYLPDNIIKKVMESPSGPSLGGEKRLVTVLITDIRGFTLLAENTDSEIIVKMLNHYFTVMVEIIHAHNGTIIEFIGDSILAIFGAPLEVEKHADYAVACAITMQREMDSVNKWNQDNGFPCMEMGIGINSGDAIVGNIGSEKAMKYNVIGKHVNLASRIESYSTGGQILVSDFTREYLTSPLTVSNTIEINPKGFSSAIPVGQVAAIGAPFNVALNDSLPGLIPLPKPVSLLCYRISEKDIHREATEIVVYAISEKEAAVSGAANLNPLDDIKLQCHDTEIMAKVNRLEAGHVILRFTSGPKAFTEKVRKLGAL